MAANDWWAAAGKDRIAQGDVFSGISFTESPGAAHPLIPAQVRGGAHGWVGIPKPKYDSSGLAPHLCMGRKNHHGIVLTHNEDLDCGIFALLAPLFPVSALPAEHFAVVTAQRSVPMLYLPAVPEFGDAFADLRFATRVPMQMLKLEHRIAEVTEAARRRLCAQLVAFFLRKSWAA